ncbi:MAG: D-alanyl-D-alanine carboxypeptidase/D-alanyl-D-alanine-endopeptidase, partial [Nitrospinales bacterium]
PAGRRNRLIVNRLARDGFNEIVVTGGIPFKGSRKRFYLSITNPALFTALTFKSFLAKAGIEFKGNVRMGKAPEDAALLVRHDSEPLALILRGLNKFSNNFVAEQLTKTLAADQFGPPGTTENGVKIIESYMKSLGYSPPRFTLVDGSGLSRQNRLSPDQIVSVLRAVYKDLSVYPELIASLAVMGLDGSVQDRMNGNPAARRARVKTGTLNSVSAISGYFQSQGGEKFVFSIMMNDLKCNNNAALKLQDKILREGLNFKRHLD